MKGVDISPEAVNIAHQIGLNVILADLTDYLHRCQEKFDVISAFDVIEHFKKEELLGVLEQLRRSLKEGGTLILQTPNALSPWASHYRYRDLTHECIFSPESIASVLRLVGYADIQIRPVEPYVHGFASALRWVFWKAAWGFCALWNLAEIGSLSGGIYTRNMMVRALRL